MFGLFKKKENCKKITAEDNQTLDKEYQKPEKKCPTPKEIEKIRYALVKTPEQMGHMFGVSEQTWLNWENGKSTPLPVFSNRLIKLRDFLRETKK